LTIEKFHFCEINLYFVEIQYLRKGFEGFMKCNAFMDLVG